MRKRRIAYLLLAVLLLVSNIMSNKSFALENSNEISKVTKEEYEKAIEIFDIEFLDEENKAIKVKGFSKDIEDIVEEEVYAEELGNLQYDGKYIEEIADDAFKNSFFPPRDDLIQLSGQLPYMPKLKKIGQGAFQGAKISGELPDMPELKKVGMLAFQEVKISGGLPDMPKLEFIGTLAFSFVNIDKSIPFRVDKNIDIQEGAFYNNVEGGGELILNLRSIEEEEKLSDEEFEELQKRLTDGKNYRLERIIRDEDIVAEIVEKIKEKTDNQDYYFKKDIEEDIEQIIQYAKNKNVDVILEEEDKNVIITVKKGIEKEEIDIQLIKKPEKPIEPEKPINPVEPEEPEELKDSSTNPGRPIMPPTNTENKLNEPNGIEEKEELEEDENKDIQNHISYIQGYEDGTIRPNNNITREEVSQILYNLLDKDYSKGIESNSNDFSDINENMWSNKAISTLAKVKILEGYSDGSFKPNKEITRGEVAVLMTRYMGIEKSNKQEFSFNDISNHWAKKYIDIIDEKNWINGYEDGNFRPDKAITRAEFVTIVNNALNREVKLENLLEDRKEFKDLKEDGWYYEAMQEAVNGHSYKELDDGTEKWIELIN